MSGEPAAGARSEPRAASREERAARSGYTPDMPDETESSMTRTYVLVVLIEIAVIAALWFMKVTFSV
jgi:hypothetical protein